MNEHLKNIWVYSFGIESLTVGIVVATSLEEARLKVCGTYGVAPLFLNFVPITAFEYHTTNPDVKEIVKL